MARNGRRLHKPPMPLTEVQVRVGRIRQATQSQDEGECQVTISDEAVEAAAEAIFDVRRSSKHYSANDLARAALDAAVSLLKQEAWEEAYGLGYADRNVGANPTRPNPYRLEEAGE